MIQNQLTSSTLIPNIYNNNNNVVQSSTPLNLSDERYTPPPSLLKRSRYEEDFYEIERIGKGGYGSVYKVQNRLDGLFYALKKIPFKNTSQAFLEKVLREVKMLASLNHINIVRYHSCWLETDDDSPISLSSSNNHLVNNNKQRSHSRNQSTQSLDVIDGNWGTSENGHRDDSTLEIDNLKTYDNSNSINLINNDKSKKIVVDNGADVVQQQDDFDDSLNRLQFPPSFEELQLFQRTTKPESKNFMKQDDDSDSEDEESTNNNKGLFRRPKQHFTSFSLDDDEDDDEVEEEEEEEETKSESNDDDDDNYIRNEGSDSEEFDFDHYKDNIDQLLPCPPKSTTPPISMPLRQSGGILNNNNNNNKQSPPKSVNISQRITTLFIVMQLYSQTLSQWLENRAPDRINKEEGLRIFKQICIGLRYIHSKGIIHRDLKPGNIFLGRTDTPSTGACADTTNDIEGEFIVSLGDYGLATHHNPNSTSPTPSPTPTSTPSLLPINSTQSILTSFASAQLDASTLSSTAATSSSTAPPQSSLLLSSSSSSSSSVPQTPLYGSVNGCVGPTPPSSTPSSSLSRSSEHCKHTSAVGTLTYSSPEQKKGLYNEKTDIYSLGIILFELYYAFSTKMEKARVLADLRNGIFPKHFVSRYPKETEMIRWMMQTNPDDRPSACDIVNSELFGQILTVPEMENIIKQQQSIIEQLKQELTLLKSPALTSIDHHYTFVPELVHNKGC